MFQKLIRERTKNPNYITGMGIPLSNVLFLFFQLAVSKFHHFGGKNIEKIKEYFLSPVNEKIVFGTIFPGIIGFFVTLPKSQKQSLLLILFPRSLIGGNMSSKSFWKPSDESQPENEKRRKDTFPPSPMIKKILKRKLEHNGRRYFDSADWVMKTNEKEPQISP